MDPGRADVHGADEGDDDWLTREEVEAWARRPFARTFDLISAEYGWTDDQILDLPLVRMRQIRDVIFERRAHDRRVALLDKEAEVRILARYIAQTGLHDKVQDAMESVDRIEFVKRPRTEPVRRVREISMSDAKRWFGDV